MITGTTTEAARLIGKLSRCYSNALLYVTLACNLRCPRCFLHDVEAEKRRYMMTWEQYERILQRLCDQRIHLGTLHFTGGEPTLWPLLKRAIHRARERHIADTIRVVTNAVDRRAEDYGDADIIHVSDYGAVNRMDWRRLKIQAGRRVKVQKTVHLPWPYQTVGQDNLPADCGCVNLAFLGDLVWPCGFAAARNAPGSLGVEENFYYRFVNGDPYRQELCRACLSNRKNKVEHMAPLTMEWGIWDSPIGGVLSWSGPAMWLRKIYRRMAFPPPRIHRPTDRSEDQE